MSCDQYSKAVSFCLNTAKFSVHTRQCTATTFVCFYFRNSCCARHLKYAAICNWDEIWCMIGYTPWGELSVFVFRNITNSYWKIILATKNWKYLMSFGIKISVKCNINDGRISSVHQRRGSHSWLRFTIYEGCLTIALRFNIL